MRRVRELQREGGLTLPLPGHGNTPRRHEMLAQLAREDLSIARIAEAHTDALAILAEGGRTGRHDCLYGVWASDGPDGRLEVTGLPDGEWRLDGLKQYCTGASFLDRALISAHGEDGLRLLEVPLSLPGIIVHSSNWATPALADTATGPVGFDAVVLPAASMIGHNNWYLERPGFWHGAVGPAACWAGGAMSLIEAAKRLNRKDPHSRAQVGALEAIGWGLQALLVQSGSDIDGDPADVHGARRRRALMLRHLIERWCTEVMDRFGRAAGPQLLAFDNQVIRQYAALTVYIRQCHAERDLASIPE